MPAIYTRNCGDVKQYFRPLPQLRDGEAGPLLICVEMAGKSSPTGPTPGVLKLMEDYHETSDDLKAAGMIGIDVRTWRGWKSGAHSPKEATLVEARTRLNLFRRVEELMGQERAASGASYLAAPAVYKGTSTSGGALDPASARLQQQNREYRKALRQVENLATTLVAIASQRLVDEGHAARTEKAGGGRGRRTSRR
jgi:hypothetical protein